MSCNNCQPCAGVQALTPQATANRAGLSELRYRVGSHSAFLETMHARLSTLCKESEQDCRDSKGPYPLGKLSTRDSNDPSIAILDCFSVLADVLTFYQERIANEGYLRTAQERRSIQELARLIGYQLKPGLSAGAHLAFTVEQDTGEIVIPKGTPAKTVPGQNELPQTFETAADITARFEWNEIKPKISRFPKITPANVGSLERLYVKASTTKVKDGDLLLFEFTGDTAITNFRRVKSIELRKDDDLAIISLVDASVSQGRFERRIGRILSDFRLALYGGTDQKRTLLEFRKGKIPILDDDKNEDSLYSILVNIQGALDKGRQQGLAKLDELLGLEITRLGLVQKDAKPSGTLLDRIGQTEPFEKITKQLNAAKPFVFDTNNKAVTNLNAKYAGFGAKLTELKKEVAGLAGTDDAGLPTAISNLHARITSGDLQGNVIAKAFAPTLESWNPAVDKKDFFKHADEILNVFAGFELRGDEPWEKLISLADLRVQAESKIHQVETKFVAAPIGVLKIDEPTITDGTGLSERTRKLYRTPYRLMSATVAEFLQDASIVHGSGAALRADIGLLTLEGRSDTDDVRKQVIALQNSLKQPSVPIGTAFVAQLKVDIPKLVGDERESVILRYPLLGRFEPAILKLSELTTAEQTKNAAIKLEKCLTDFLEHLTQSNATIPDPLTETSWRDYLLRLQDWEQKYGDLQADLNKIAISATHTDKEKEYYATLQKALTGISKDLANRIGTLENDQQDNWYATTVLKLLERYPQPATLSAEDNKILTNLADEEFLKNIGNPLAGKDEFKLGSKVADYLVKLLQKHTDLADLSGKHTTGFVALSNAIAKVVPPPPLPQAGSGEIYTGLAHELNTVRTDLGTSFRDRLKASIEGVNLKDETHDSLVKTRELITNLTDWMTNNEKLIELNIGKSSQLYLNGFFKLLTDELAKLVNAGVLSAEGIPQTFPNTAIGELVRRTVLPDLVARRDELGPPLRTETINLATTSEFREAGLSNTVERLVSPSNRLAYVPARIDAKHQFAQDARAKLLKLLSPNLRGNLFVAWKNIQPVPVTFHVHLMTTRASLFGHNALRQPEKDVNPLVSKIDWDVVFEPDATKRDPASSEHPNALFLEREFEELKNEKYILLSPFSELEVKNPRGEEELAFEGVKIRKVVRSASVSRVAYGITGKTTRVEIDKAWWDPGKGKGDEKITKLRQTGVYIRSQTLELLDEPFTIPIGDVKRGVGPSGSDTASDKTLDLFERSSNEVELSTLYEGLNPARLLLIDGERADVQGVRVQEVVRLSNATHIWRDWPNERPHTLLTFTKPLQYAYKRDTVRLFANVAAATHGETQREIVGSGDASKALQRFSLSKVGVTHLPSAFGTGAVPEVEVRVNDVLWDRAPDLLSMEGAERYSVLVQDGQMVLQFGDGVRGTRLPTGIENVRAKYRVGIGLAGNVKMGQISQLTSPVLGVRQVTNPVRTTGGVDPENVFQGRRSTGQYPTNLGRLVSLQDYEDFARNFGGIAKAAARRRIEDGQTLVDVYVAAGDDAPLDPDTQLLLNLERALENSGSAQLQVSVRPRSTIVLGLIAEIAVNARMLRENVFAGIRTALLDHFSFERSDFGRDIPLSKVLSVIQQVSGVEFVRITKFDGISDSRVSTQTGSQEGNWLDSLIGKVQNVPVDFHEIAYFTPAVTETIQLTEVAR